jgi:hypothetical protein
MIKKLVGLLLILVTVFAAAACGPKSQPGSDPTDGGGDGGEGVVFANDIVFAGDSFMDKAFWTSFDSDFADGKYVNLGVGGTTVG